MRKWKKVISRPPPKTGGHILGPRDSYSSVGSLRDPAFNPNRPDLSTQARLSPSRPPPGPAQPGRGRPGPSSPDRGRPGLVWTGLAPPGRGRPGSGRARGVPGRHRRHRRQRLAITLAITLAICHALAMAMAKKTPPRALRKTPFSDNLATTGPKTKDLQTFVNLPCVAKRAEREKGGDLQKTGQI